MSAGVINITIVVAVVSDRSKISLSLLLPADAASSAFFHAVMAINGHTCFTFKKSYILQHLYKRWRDIDFVESLDVPGLVVLFAQYDLVTMAIEFRGK